MVSWKILRNDALKILGQAKIKEIEALAKKNKIDLNNTDLSNIFMQLCKKEKITKNQYAQLGKAFMLRSEEADAKTMLPKTREQAVPRTHANGRSIEDLADDEIPMDAFDEEEYIGRYKILDELGEGGMGKVYRCEDTSFESVKREVALKKLLLPYGQAKNKKAQAELQHRIERAKREAGLTAILARHDNIIKIYDSGTDPADGSYFYVMEVINGKEWDKIIETVADLRKANKTLPERYSMENMLEIFLKVCDAMAYAHSEGVIHRDLKPENIMVDEKFGSVKVMDWGLAKLIEEQDTLRLTMSKKSLEEYMQNMDTGRTVTALTIDGQIMGTPRFMGPEQAQNAKRLDATADVYSLGATLYYVLTGQPPITTKGSILNLLKLIKKGAITPPTKLKNTLYQIPPEIDAIVMKALANDKRRRYPTAKELALDVRAFLAKKDVSAYKYSFSEKARRFVERNATATIAAFLITTSLGAGGFLYQSKSASDARASAEAARAAASDAKAKEAEKDKKIAKKDAQIAKKEKQRAEIAKKLAQEAERTAQLETIIAKQKLVAAEKEVEGQRFSEATLQGLERLTQDRRYYAAALGIINRAISESEDYWKPYLIRAKHQATFGHHAEAERDFQIANETFKKQFKKYSVEIWFEAGMHYGLPETLGGRGEENRALEFFRKAYEADSEDVFGQLARAIALVIEAKNRPSTAEDKISESIDITDELIEDEIAMGLDATWLVRAWILGATTFSGYDTPAFRKNADLEEAKSSLLEVLEGKKSNIHLKNFLATIYSDLGEYDQAIQIYSEIIKVTQNFVGYSNRGAARAKKGDLDGAINDLNKAIELNPEWPQAYVTRGSVFDQQGLIKKAEQDLTTAVNKNPQNIRALFVRGSFYARHTELERAKKDFRAILALNSQHSKAQFEYGLCCMHQNNLEEALTHLTRSIELDKTQVLGYYNLARIYKLRRNYDRALEYYNTAVANGPAKGQYRGITYNGRADLYLIIDQLEKAETDARKSMSLGYALGYVTFGEILMKKGDYSGAERAFEDAYEKAPKFKALIDRNMKELRKLKKK